MIIDFDFITIIILYFIFIGIALFIKKKYKKPNIYFLFYFIFTIYITVLIKYSFFPIMKLSIIEDIPQNVFDNMNLIPFKNFIQYTNLLNVIMTIPLGFGLPFVRKVENIKPVLLVGILSGVTIEFVQFITAIIVGFSFRAIDINDIICNFIGVIGGFYILKLMGNIMINLFKDSINENIVFNYINSIILRITEKI